MIGDEAMVVGKVEMMVIEMPQMEVEMGWDGGSEFDKAGEVVQWWMQWKVEMMVLVVGFGTGEMKGEVKMRHCELSLGPLTYKENVDMELK